MKILIHLLILMSFQTCMTLFLNKQLEILKTAISLQLQWMEDI